MSFKEYKSAEYWQQQREKKASVSASMNATGNNVKDFFAAIGLTVAFVGAYWLMAILEL